MIDNQLRPNHIVDEKIINAFLNTPREDYVFQEQRHISYSDQLITLKKNRYLLPALTFAQMLQNLKLKENDRVLVIGCTLGYSIEILSHLNITVFGIDHEFFIDQAVKLNPTLKKNLKIEPLIMGCPKYGPYDAIIIEGGIKSIPYNLIHQLKENGQLGTLVYQNPEALFLGSIFQKKNETLEPIDTFDTVGYLLPDFEKEDIFSF